MTSNPFKSIPQRYIHKLATEWVARHWLVLIAPITAAIIWAIMDVRAIYVVLILVFIVYPLAITFVWFNYALSPRSIKAITEKQVTVVDEGLKIDYLPAREDAPAIRSDFIAWRDVNQSSGRQFFGRGLVCHHEERLKRSSSNRHGLTRSTLAQILR